MKTAMTTRPVATAIEALREALRTEYGDDYAFTIMGGGYTISASNMVHGSLVPRSKLQPTGDHARDRLVAARLNLTEKDSDR